MPLIGCDECAFASRIIEPEIKMKYDIKQVVCKGKLRNYMRICPNADPMRCDNCVFCNKLTLLQQIKKEFAPKHYEYSLHWQIDCQLEGFFEEILRQKRGKVMIKPTCSLWQSQYERSHPPSGLTVKEIEKREMV